MLNLPPHGLIIKVHKKARPVRGKAQGPTHNIHVNGRKTLLEKEKPKRLRFLNIMRKRIGEKQAPGNLEKYQKGSAAWKSSVQTPHIGVPANIVSTLF